MTGRRLAWGAAGLAAVILLASLAWGLAHPAGGQSETVLGRPAPDIVIQSLDGGHVSLAALRGRPVVLNFWASWCGPCRQEEGALKSAAQRWAGTVAFLGVNIQDSLDAARTYQSQARYPYPVGQPVSQVPDAYGVRGPPVTFFIDSQGVAAARFLGPLDSGLIDRYLELVGVK